MDCLLFTVTVFTELGIRCMDTGRLAAILVQTADFLLAQIEILHHLRVVAQVDVVGIGVHFYVDNEFVQGIIGRGLNLECELVEGLFELRRHEKIQSFGCSGLDDVVVALDDGLEDVDTVDTFDVERETFVQAGAEDLLVDELDELLCNSNEIGGDPELRAFETSAPVRVDFSVLTSALIG